MAALFSMDGLEFTLRWVHFLAGITWIGLLYYFNFVQGEWFKETDGATKSAAIMKLVPRALLWFRMAAALTFTVGVLILGMKGHTAGIELFKTSYGILILTGSLLGTIMFLNVWLIIWPNQKIVIASTEQVAKGSPPALPEAAAAAARAGLASRSNVLFSIPMLFFMGAASHLPLNVDENANLTLLAIILTGIIGLLEFNAIKGKLGPLTTIKGVIHCGLGLAILLYTVIEVIC